MSDCDGLQNKLGMSPCSKGNDVPQNTEDEWSENIENFEQVHENGGDVIVSSDSDEDGENLAAQGYISLAQSEDDIAANEIEQAEQETSADSNEEKPDIQTEDPEESRTFPSGSSTAAFSSSSQAQMGEDEINLIKSVMTNIQLPSSAIPEWAKKVPEEKWKQPLVSALQQRTNKK
ncbi:uncharacterized protein LOC114520223 [Dendronephthya gigantea]|uniref:uncharacterized protein LOC114520223 n=1 Tax=Dendronephthya gigantea TaxID=151771 RepID=UPI00106BF4F8|nr:uncharacterized protein LOC114520223 [Dendronephthya gigantea]